MYTFGLCSLWHLAAVSVVKCTVIVRPLTHFTIFTDRILRAIICVLWILSLVVVGAMNLGGIDLHFNWATMTAVLKRQNTAITYGIGVISFVTATLIIMISYTKVFLVVRRQVNSTPNDVLGSFGSSTIFGTSVRSAKNLFVICAVYYLTYVPVNIGQVIRNVGLKIPDAVQFTITWIYISSATLDGLLYIALHSSVRRELRRYLPRCRRPTVAVAPSTRVVGVGVSHRHVNTGIAPPVAPVLTSSCQRVAIQLPEATV